MQFELLKEFQVFSRGQNLSHAAKTLHITQSCLSKHLAELESETGLALLNHGQTNVSLTPVGEYFLQETSCLLASWEDLMRHCRKIQAATTGYLTIQHLLDGNNANLTLYNLAREYRESHPNLDISFKKLVDFSPMDVLQKGDFDVSVEVCCGDQDSFLTMVEQRDLLALPFLREPLMLWYENDNPFASMDSIRLEDFVRVPIMMSASQNFDYIRNLLSDIFERYDMVPFFKPVHFDFDSPASFFLTDLKGSVLVTSPGMLNTPCLSMRTDISHRIIDDPRLMMTVYLLASKENQKASDFFGFAKDFIERKPE